MKKILIIFKVLFSIPKTIYFNFKIFDIKTAIKLPVLITNNVKVLEIHRNSFILNMKKIKPFMIKIGLSGSYAINSNRGKLFVNKKSKIIFNGEAIFSEGIILYNNGGITEFGNNFIANKNCFISCDSNITFGDDVLIGWNVNIRDSDGHFIIVNDGIKENVGNVKIGNHVWICSFVDILKNSFVGNDCVIAYKSCLTGKKIGDNKLVGGYPARVLNENINWKK